MFTKRRKVMCKILWVGTIVCFMGFMFTIPCSAQKVKAPKGEIVVVLADTFCMTGGDCHTSNGVGGVTITTLIHESLIRKDQKGTVLPALAKSWEISKDGLSMKFTLNERAKFHNGEPVTANDVKFSIERVLRPELKYFVGLTLKNRLDRIEVMDDHHITIYFKAPYPSFLDICGETFGIVPKAYVEKVGDAEFAKHPIGAGPFKWVDYQQDVFVKAEAVEDHYRKVPAVKTVTIKYITEPATIVAMLKAGEADVVQLPLSNIKEVQDNPKLKVVWSKFVAARSIAFCDLMHPNESSPFHDARVRQAVSYAINRKAICEKLLYGSAELWGDIFAPYNPGVDPKLMPDPYDPEKAKALLREAGYPNGFDTTFTYGFLGDKIEAQAMAADLTKVGIRSKLVELEFGTYIKNMNQKTFRGLTRNSNPWWGGRKYPGAPFEAVFSQKSIWALSTTPETEAVWEKISILTDEKEIAAQAKVLRRAWKELDIRYMLWAYHQPFGLSQKVKYYENVPGRSHTSRLEYLELKD